MLTKDGRDTAIENLTADNYIVPQGEEKYYHAVIEVKQFNPKTGKRTSVPRVQKFGKKAFETSVRDTLKKQGFDIVVLHDPNKWLAEQKEKAAKVAAEQTEAKAKAEKEKFDAAVAAAVEKALAEQAAKTKTDAPDYTKDNPEYAKEKKPGRPAKTETEK